MNARQEWLTRRQQGIGGSDVAAILGVSPYRTPLDVYLSKVEPAKDEEMGEAAYWGTALEPVVASEYARRTQRQVQRINTLVAMPGEPWMIANLDRAIVSPGSRARVDKSSGFVAGADGVLEVKTASAYLAGAWGRPDQDDDEAIPLHYAAQGMHYLAVTGLPWCDFAVLIGGQKFITKRLERDEATIAAIREKCGAFWHDHVLARVAPAPVNVDDVLRLFPGDSGRVIEATGDVLALINEAKVLRTQVKESDARLDAIKAELQLAMQDASAIAMDGKPIVTWKKAADSQAVDWKAALDSFRGVWISDEEADAAVARATTTRAGSRRFLIK